MKRGTSISFLSLLMLLMATTAQATDISTITVGGVEYSLFSGFTVTAGHGGGDYSYLVDGNNNTRWESAALDDTDEAYEVQFRPDDNIAAVIPKGYILVNGASQNAGWSLAARLGDTGYWHYLSIWATALVGANTYNVACDNSDNRAFNRFFFKFNGGGPIIWELRIYGWYYTHLTAKAATCTETGIRECYYRSDGKYFTDLTGETELSASDVIEPMLPHTGVPKVTPDTNVEYWQCSVCGKYFSDAACTVEIAHPHTGVHGVFPNNIEYWQCSCGKYFSDAGCTEEIIPLTSGTTSWTQGWYVVTEGVTIPDRITVSGEVSLILCDNTTLTASKGITVGSSATLNIYAQPDDEATMGALVANATSEWDCAGIGGVNRTNFGTVVINGGKITATGNNAGIGGGYGSTAGSITINGGIVNATARNNSNSAGIGGGRYGYVASVTLNGGIITATGDAGYGGAGIGAGSYADSGTMTVTIGSGVKKLVATRGKNSDCIGNALKASTTVNVVFKNGETIVEGDDKDAVFYDSGESSVRLVRVKALNHHVSMSNDLKANITAMPEYALAGETVTLTLGTAVDASTLTVNDGTSDLTLTDKGSRQYSFVMPDGNVTVTATILVPHSITIGADLQAHVTASAASAYKGETVTLTLDYAVDEATLTVSDGTNNLALTDKGNRQYSFVMPDGDVTVTATPLPPHSITIGNDLQAHVTASAASAYRGETITLTLDNLVDETMLTVSDGTNNVALTDKGNRQYSFVMPDGNVTVTATILVPHSITIGNDLQVHVTASAASALRGETITLTLDALVDETTLTVSDGTNNLTLTDRGNRQYSFVMPDGDVTVTATLFTADLRDGVAYDRTSDFVVAAATYRKTLGEERVGKHQAWLVPFDYTITNEDVEKFTFYKINMIANSPSPSVEATDEMWVFLTKLDAGAILHGGMPYVYKPLEAVTDYAFTTAPATLKAKNTGVLITMMTAEDTYTVYATYANTTATADNPFYYVSIDGGISLGNDGSVTVGPYRWIIRKESKFGSTPTYARRMYFYDGEDVTSIASIASPQPSPKGKGVMDGSNQSPLLQEGTGEAWYDLSGRKVNSQLAPGVYVVKGKKVIIR